MIRTKLAAAALLSLLAAGPAGAEVKTKELSYAQGGTPLQGFLAWDDAAKGKRPGVLVLHEWWGHNQHARNQAVRLAKAGYVALALDMFGEGKVTTHPEDAKGFVAEVTRQSGLLKARYDAARDLLLAQPQVDRERTAAFGYCFGGTVALQLARGGEDLDALVAFHAGLAPQGPPAEKGKVKPRILVLEGGADPFVPPEQVKAFEEEMKAAGADVRVVVYPGVKHGFTNPDAGKAGLPALAYDADADAKSWAAAVAFLRQVFGG
jgi:dienelactone hydrolase